VPPESRVICRFAAEPPQEGVPYGRWADRLRTEFLAACLRIDAEDVDLGEPLDIAWHPDRTWDGRTYVPATARTTTGLELFGFVSFAPGHGDVEPDHFAAVADFTDELAEDHPDWRMDLCDEVLGGWRGEEGNVAAMTLVWGRPLVDGGALVTAELAGLAVDQCALVEGRFTLIAPDDYRGDTLEVKLWDARGDRLAAESLYDEGDEDAA
jgi:hypothetical protein